MPLKPGYTAVVPQLPDLANEIGRTFQSISKWTNEYQTQIDGIARSLQDIGAQIGEAFTQLQKNWEQAIGPMLEDIHRGFEARLKAYPNLSPRLEILAKRGWFISLFFGLSEFDQIAMAVGDTDNKGLEAILCKTYSESIEEHVTSILREFPEREFVIKPALDAHLRGEFALSVPVFFSQADGIAYAAIGKHLFSKTEGKDGIFRFASAEIEKLKDQSDDGSFDLIRIIHLALWHPLTDHQPIAYSSTKREAENYDGLNRHMVLHGESLDYATEENSLKAFSFLSYVASLLSQKDS
jgi:hypothetical protein